MTWALRAPRIHMDAELEAQWDAKQTNTLMQDSATINAQMASIMVTVQSAGKDAPPVWSSVVLSACVKETNVTLILR